MTMIKCMLCNQQEGLAMSDIKRYAHNYKNMEAHDEGNYVQYSDYTAFRSALKAADAVIKRHENLVSRFKGAYYSRMIKEKWDEYIDYIAAKNKAGV